MIMAGVGVLAGAQRGPEQPATTPRPHAGDGQQRAEPQRPAAQRGAAPTPPPRSATKPSAVGAQQVLTPASPRGDASVAEPGVSQP